MQKLKVGDTVQVRSGAERTQKTNRGKILEIDRTAGRVRVTFTAADMAASGSRELQTRELTLRVTHSSGQVFHCAVVFRISNFRDA